MVTSQPFTVTATMESPPPPPPPPPTPPPSPPPSGAPLSVSVSPSVSSGNAPLDVSFLSFVSGGVAPYSYAWDFGDGSPSSAAQYPGHTYQNAGTYTVTLVVTDSGGNSGSAKTVITVSSAPTTPPPTGAQKIVVKVSQPNGPGTAPQWNISGLTPGGKFTVQEQVSSVGPTGSRLFFNDEFIETADASGNSVLAFNVDGGVAGNVVGLMVIDDTTNATGGTTYLLQ